MYVHYVVKINPTCDAQSDNIFLVGKLCLDIFHYYAVNTLAPSTYTSLLLC